MKKWVSLLMVLVLLCVPMLSGCGLGKTNEVSAPPMEEEVPESYTCDACGGTAYPETVYHIDAENSIFCPRTNGNRDHYAFYTVYYECKDCGKTVERFDTEPRQFCEYLKIFFDGDHP